MKIISASNPSLIIGLICFMAAVGQSEANEDYQIKARDLHNQYRAKHGAGALHLTEDLNHRALQCAQYYLSKKVFDMSCPHKLTAGENLYAMGGGKGDADLVTQKAIDNWYKKGDNYKFTSDDVQLKAGQFTQMIWKSAKEMGFAAVVGDGMGVAVALYDPPGNVVGQFKENVQNIQ